jgi:cyanophycinase
MKFIFSLALIFPLISFGQTKLLLIGGGARPVEAMKEFVHLAQGTQSHILIIPWASQTLESAEKIKFEFASHGAKKIEIIPHELSPADLIQLQEKIRLSTGIFFTGGNQNSLMASIKKFQLTDLIKNKFQQGAMMGGTSAGTAIMSDPMLNGEANLAVIDGAQVGLTQGLGLLPKSIIVDQHFIVRGRFNRLAGLILDQKAHMGLAIDENTSLLIINNKAKVIGPTQVLLFTKSTEDTLQIMIKAPHSEFQL